MSMKIRPLHDRVVIRREEEETKSPGGIVIPDTASKDKPIRGEIIAAGPGKTDENGKVHPLTVKKGDKVVFGKYAGTEIKLDNDKEEYVIMREDDILGIIETK